MLKDIIENWGGYEVSSMEMYKDIFQLGHNEIQKSDEQSGQFKSNPVAYYKNNNEKKGHFRIMFEDTFEETLKELQKADFAILNGITYFGRRNVQTHASKMYAMIFDLDGVNDAKLNNFFSGAFKANAYPIPNYVVLSGHGVHFYYLFEQAIPLYPNLKLQLKELKYALVERIWNKYTSVEEKKQFQGINQGFRVAGGMTKPGSPIQKTQAYLLNSHPYSLYQLNNYVPERYQVDEKKLFKETKTTLAKAKEKWPQWYEKVVVNNDKRPKKWDISGKVHGDNPFALYDWWLKNILNGATYHHRYFSIMCLAIYAVKCDIPYEKLEKDAYDLIPFLNDINPEEPFTMDDVNSALECYDDRYYTFPIKDISKLAGIAITQNKRNGRNRKAHLYLARRRKEDMKVIGEEVNEGRPNKEKIVANWRRVNPTGKKADCIRATGLDKKTVYKWWNS